MSNRYKAKKITHCFSEQNSIKSDSIIKLEPVGMVNFPSQPTACYTEQDTVIYSREITFDSQFEYRVFQVIHAKYPSKDILVHPYFKLSSSPELCRLNGELTCTKFTDLFKFNPDFAISKTNKPTIDNVDLIIEAKGLMARDFLLRLYIFLQFFPSLGKKYIIVFQDRSYLSSQNLQRLIKQFGITALQLKDLPDYLNRFQAKK